MDSATRIVTSAFGMLVALIGAEHGVGELLQGSVRPSGLVIQSWPDAAFFRIEAGEPAMSIVPNLLASGVLTVLASLAFTVWNVDNSALVVFFIAAMVLLALTIVSGRARDAERPTATAHAVAR